MCRGNPYKDIPSTTVTTSQGRAGYESTIPQSTDEGLDLWEAPFLFTLLPPKLTRLLDPTFC